MMSVDTVIQVSVYDDSGVVIWNAIARNECTINRDGNDGNQTSSDRW